MKYLKKVTAAAAALSILAGLCSGFTFTASAEGETIEPPRPGWTQGTQNREIEEDGVHYQVGDEWLDGQNLWLVVDTPEELFNIATLYEKAKDDNTKLITTYNIMLGKDIDMAPIKDWVNAIGTVKCPFDKEFDGDDHTIDHLVTNDNLLTSDGGLFGSIGPNAVLHDVIIDHADVDSVVRGGVVAGLATGSQIYNVSVKNSKLKLRSGGVGVELITAGGIRGGAIAGGAIQNAYLYNCTSYNTEIFVDSDAGVSALAGDGFYVGGLVGNLLGSTIEYSRVTGDNNGVQPPSDNDKGDSDVNKELLTSPYKAKVTVRYTTGLSALGGLKLYAGGIAGQTDTDEIEYDEKEGRRTQTRGANVQSYIIDCFANAHVGYYGRPTLAVGAGVSGAAGGIVGKMTDNNGTIERCQFAGLLTSRTYNNVLGIGGYTNNSHLGGIVGYVSNDKKGVPNVTHCYYDWDRASKGKKTPQIPPVQGCTPADCEMVSHSAYNYQKAWVQRTFDFDDSHKRDKQEADYIHTGQHYNRWVIDHSENMYMPVHGFGLNAVTDFPGAGMITIEGTAYRDAVSTNGIKADGTTGEIITQ